MFVQKVAVRLFANKVILQSTICQQGEENIPTNCQLGTHTVANIHDNCNKDNNNSLLKRVVNISTLLVGKVPDSVTND